MAKTSPKMAQARRWHDAGGRLRVILSTAYGPGDRERRCIHYRMHDGESEYSPFVELTKFQAKRFLSPAQWELIETMEDIGRRLTSPQFRDRVELNQQRRTDPVLSARIGCWEKGRHPMETWPTAETVAA